jgi:penicillin-binding protein-related factor A (putative recombinase)
MPAKTNYFEGETSKSLKHVEESMKRFMWFKIPDTKTLRYHPGGYSNNLILEKVPCDFIALNSGRMVMLECKSSRSPASYSLSYIRPHQLEYLIRAGDCGGRGWFLINSRKGRGSIRAYAVHPFLIQRWMDWGLKSVKWSTLDKEAIPLNRIKGMNGVWDLKPLFSII